ncbi:hypothetical protein V3C99_018328 [Haemonchus contortus]|uniref:Uncharacterized protein n=1 Tax=Haemonchus contortus TaxID=6289 RepID=A0A7I4Z1T9_HAECO
MFLIGKDTQRSGVAIANADSFKGPVFADNRSSNSNYSEDRHEKITTATPQGVELCGSHHSSSYGQSELERQGVAYAM